MSETISYEKMSKMRLKTNIASALMDAMWAAVLGHLIIRGNQLVTATKSVAMEPE